MNGGLRHPSSTAEAAEYRDGLNIYFYCAGVVRGVRCLPLSAAQYIINF